MSNVVAWPSHFICIKQKVTNEDVTFRLLPIIPLDPTPDEWRGDFRADKSREKIDNKQRVGFNRISSSKERAS